jgi:hypothetical protein
MDNGRDEDGRFTENNRIALKHGGERAIKSLQHGEPLRGVCADLAAEVAVELERDGLVETMRRMAIDHAAVCRLYFGLILAETDEISLDKWVKRFGWLSGRCFNMLRDLAKLEASRDGGAVMDYETILAQKQAEQ